LNIFVNLVEELGEFETISNIRHLAQKVKLSDAVPLGIGDDCCLLTPGEDEELALSTDSIVEDVHFRFSYFNYYQVGVKAMAAALSDLAAMAARPLGALVSVSIKTAAAGTELGQLARGLIDSGARFSCPLIGGDLTTSPGPLVVNVTVVGRVKKGCAIKRSTARIGDQIWVTGTPGDSAAVLARFEKVASGESAALPQPDESSIMRFLEPVPRLNEAFLLENTGALSAMIDISDGLVADLNHILEESAVGAVLFGESLPVSEFSKAMARALRLPPDHFCLYGGEDYELLFTAAPGFISEHRQRLEEKTGTKLSLIGEITGNRGQLQVARAHGRLETIRKKGFDHFPDNALPGKELS